MAFSRKFLKEILSSYDNAADLIDKIIEEHVATIAPLKAERDALQEQAGGKSVEDISAELERVTAELERLKAEEVDENGKPWKTRYEGEKARYDAFKEKAEARAAYDEKAKAFRSMLIQAGVKYSVVDVLVRGSGDIINGLELQDGKVRNHETVSAAICREFGDFIGKSNNARPACVAPTRESITSNLADRNARIEAIRKNPQMFRE